MYTFCTFNSVKYNATEEMSAFEITAYTIAAPAEWLYTTGAFLLFINRNDVKNRKKKQVERKISYKKKNILQHIRLHCKMDSTAF